MALKSLYHRKTLYESFMPRRKLPPDTASIVELVRRSGGTPAVQALATEANAAIIRSHERTAGQAEPDPDGDGDGAEEQRRKVRR
jgi:hypothetical protein